MPLDKPFDQINKDDIDELVARGNAEKKTLEYKKELVFDQPSNRKEFLFDISSFANSSGGHIFFGVEEKEGVPITIPGLPWVNPDTLISTLENTCRDGIEPRIPGLHMKAIPIPGNPPELLRTRRAVGSTTANDLVHWADTPHITYSSTSNVSCVSSNI